MAVNADVLRLVQTTLRTFYEPRFVILIDQLIRKEAMRDEELAARIGLTTKDVAKIANKLAEDGFIASHRRSELRQGGIKAVPRTWYYIDFQRTIDVIKWRMFKIRKVIDDKLRNEIDSQGYVCPRCKKSFSTLDANSLIDFDSNTMRCDVCGTEVIDNENVEEVRRSKDQMNRLLRQTKPIVDGLRKTEQKPLQSFDIAAWLEKHAPIAAADMLPTASGSAPAKVTIELVNNSDDDEARRRKEAEAESKRQQNALPSWIERSTVTGELTAAGTAQQALPSISHTGDEAVNQDGSSSPRKGTAEDDVDKYYASLAAAQATGPAAAISVSYSYIIKREEQDETGTQQGSPSSGGVASANSKLIDSGYEEFGEDFQSASPASAFSPATADVNSFPPSDLASSHGNTGRAISRAQYRNPSLRPPSAASISNSLGKRSREPSEDSESDKKIRTNAGTPAPVAEKAPDLPNEEGTDLVGAEEVPEEGDDPILTVAGKEIRFTVITEEMTNDMTPEEYQLYWDTMAVMG